MTDHPQYGAAWQTDDPSGVPYIVESSGKRLYRHPPCEICGTMRTSYSATPTFPQCADFIQGVGCIPAKCSFAQPEGNDNVHPLDQDQLGLFRP